MAALRRCHCRFCAAVLPAWLPAAKRCDGALLLGHLSQPHPKELKLYLEGVIGQM
jgi:hypothetical protein